jgi:DNA (cytosine-5)-methyltransferase 1
MKPSYAIPTMEEINKIKGTNNYSVISTFSGCGGSCLGFEMDGYKVLYGNEFIEQAQITYKANHPEVLLDERDIRDVTGKDILDKINKKVGEIDVLEGSPPCASFSTAGSREKGWGKQKKYSDKSQRADDLFFEYSRILKELQPKVFVAENVSGLVKGKAIGYFKQILTHLQNNGYQVEAKVLDASWLGVPQARQRLIFVGIRKDLANKYQLKPAFPKPLSYQHTLREVLPNVTLMKFGGKPNNWKTVNVPAPTLVAGDADISPTGYFTSGGFVETIDVITHDPETGQDIRLDKYAIGPEWDKLKMGEQSKKYFQLVKPNLLRPIGTIVATAGGIGAAGSTHPTQKRKFTLEELRLLSSFPADFILTGNYAQRWERIGRSVPPLMMYQIAKTIRQEILEKIND